MLQIIYQDETLVAINKPSGLLVHRSDIDRRANSFALQMLRDQTNRYVYPVHRLDRPTSGVLLFALSPDTAHRMVQLFARHRVEKTYLAVVRGFVDDAGRINTPGKKVVDRKIRADFHPSRTHSTAITDYVRLATIELPEPVGRYSTTRYSLVRIVPQTGRRHQIRKHFKHISHPIVGDTEYGDGRHNRFARSAWQCDRLLLAAVELSFEHPYSQRRVKIQAPLDDTFFSVLKKLDWINAVPPAWLPQNGGTASEDRGNSSP